MRHHNKNRKFGREKKERAALLSSLALALISKKKIKTTEARAKELRPIIEKMVTIARNNNLNSRRIIISRLFNNTTEVKKLFDDIAPKYKDRKGGYTRIIKLPPRLSDSSRMAIIEFV